jgi:mannose/cellobiose epimerase-like protein (N-acyl-D-glucosamine 2-epimerase family)
VTVLSREIAREWLFDRVLPFWSRHGIDRTFGGFVEELRLDASNANVDVKRTRVTARQIYVFSHAALLGVPGAGDLARHGFDFLTTKAWLGQSAGWARRLDRSGAVVDETPDLYDLAFVLFALGWYYRATRDSDAVVWADRTVAFIDAHMRHPAGGFVHEKGAGPPLQQNPHMHLLEAALANIEATGGTRYQALAVEVAELFSQRLYDAKSRTLVEHYDGNWRRLADPAAQVVEPGHHYEWAWILANYQRLTGHRMEGAIRGLIEFAEEFGVDPATGSVVNAIGVDGTVFDPGFRVWPNAERLQAAVAGFEVFGTDPRPVFADTIRVLFRLFVDQAPCGTWFDRSDVNGRPTVDKIPASTLYHVMIAVTEMLRIEGAVSKRFAVGAHIKPAVAL